LKIFIRLFLTQRSTEPLVYWRRYNFELQREFDSPCVINIVKTNRLRYAGHMIRKPEGSDCKLIVAPDN
jgi:hypothetical protein